MRIGTESFSRLFFQFISGFYEVFFLVTFNPTFFILEAKKLRRQNNYLFPATDVIQIIHTRLWMSWSILALQVAQDLFFLSHLSMQALWKWCLQGNTLSSSLLWYSTKQTTHRASEVEICNPPWHLPPPLAVRWNLIKWHFVFVAGLREHINSAQINQLFDGSRCVISHLCRWVVLSMRRYEAPLRTILEDDVRL